ncbi:hypothetical protein ERAN111884_03285 [Erysipelothrix anatis]
MISDGTIKHNDNAKRLSHAGIVVHDTWKTNVMTTL